VILLSFELRPSKRVRKQIEKLERKSKLNLLDLFLKLKESPVPAEEFNVAKLSGSKNTYRIRLQKIRVIYDVYWKEKKLELLKVDTRKGRTYK
jgi:mRNA-degrading endonuclease RelE of RelBE toxin-antitoxin system